MKKILLAILLLFTLVACGNLETYHTPPALKKGQKTVRLVNFPIAFEGSLTKELENYDKYEKEDILYSIWGNKWKKFFKE